MWVKRKKCVAKNVRVRKRREVEEELVGGAEGLEERLKKS